jgi:hypothetical protein
MRRPKTPGRAAVRPAVLPIVPEPASYLIYRHPPGRPTLTVLTMEWDNGDEKFCRRCPRAACGVTERGTCTRVLPGNLSERDAVAFVFPDKP